MKTSIKGTAFIMLMGFMLSGCAHKNIVQNATMNRLRLKDVKTGKERVYDCSGYASIQSNIIWLAPGDYVGMSARGYDLDSVFTPKNAHLTCDWVEMQRRKTEFENARLRYEIQANYPKTK
ncbi:MAG: hypothetical protein J6T57_02905 [Alphaproteobacteria bacterium]|nr:hypothetical protein [Alphaproteobacteria bacterium]